MHSVRLRLRAEIEDDGSILIFVNNRAEWALAWRYYRVNRRREPRRTGLIMVSVPDRQGRWRNPKDRIPVILSPGLLADEMEYDRWLRGACHQTKAAQLRFYARTMVELRGLLRVSPCVRRYYERYLVNTSPREK